MEVDYAKIDCFISRYGNDPGALIQTLQDIQTEYRYLPREALEYVSEKLDVPLAGTYNVATFYNAFSLLPKGRHHICVCLGTACHVRGAQGIMDKFARELKIEPGHTTQDLEYSLDHVACLGACALGPIVTVGEEYFGQMELRKVDKILKQFRKGGKKTDVAEDEEDDQS
jgi:NADH-quinone oxidoreductase subunit E